MNKLMIFSAGVLAAIAFAALPVGASAAEIEVHCSASPCEGVVEATGPAVRADDSGLTVQCQKTTGTVTQSAATSTTVSVVLGFDECGVCNFGTNTLTGHFITVVKDDSKTAAILLTGFNTAPNCFGFNKSLAGNLIGTIEDPECGSAVTHLTISFTQSSVGQQTDKTYTGGTFDLLLNGTTTSQTGTAHINYKGGKTVTITC